MPIPMQIPIGMEADFKGVIDLLEMQAIYWEDELGREATYTDIPADLLPQAQASRAHLVESIVELDDDLTHQVS